jgi:hypothetical protein
MDRNVLEPVDFQISDEQLHKVLIEIDTELRASSPQVYGRELRGWMAFCRKFHLQMAMHDPLARRIFDWFTQQYGDRLKGNLDFGTTAVQIRQDIYPMRLPCFYGRGLIYCDPALPPVPSDGIRVNAPFKARLFEYVQGLTPEFIKAVSPDDCNNMIDAYARGFLGFSRMRDVQGAPFSKEALDDLLQSAVHLTSHSPNYGFSRWASLQATEKTLKSYIVQNGGKLEKIHKLSELEKTASVAGLPPLQPSLISDIQCSADVRYAAQSVTKADALKAHYAVLNVCAQIAPLLKTQSGWVSDIKIGSYELAGKKSPIKGLMVIRGKPRT